MSNIKFIKFLLEKNKLINCRLQSLKNSGIADDDERFKVVEGMKYAYEEMINFLNIKERKNKFLGKGD